MKVYEGAEINLFFIKIWVCRFQLLEWLIYFYEQSFRYIVNTSSLDFIFWNLNLFWHKLRTFPTDFCRLRAKLGHWCCKFFYGIVGKIWKDLFGKESNVKQLIRCPTRTTQHFHSHRSYLTNTQEYILQSGIID